MNKTDEGSFRRRLRSSGLCDSSLRLLTVSLLTVCALTAFRSFIGKAHLAPINVSELSNAKTEIIDGWSASQAAQVWIEPVTKMEFALIPAGSLLMGSPPNE